MDSKDKSSARALEIEQTEEFIEQLQRSAANIIPLDDPYRELHPERILGVYESHYPGPTIVCTGGIHGNEPAALHAIRRVIRLLHEKRPPFRGKLIGLGGNLPALANAKRFIDADLNRIWTSKRMDAIKKQDFPQEFPSETDQQLELFCILAGLIRESEELFLMDLHTTSSQSAPFLILDDTPEYRSYADSLPVPVIFGLSEELEGTLIHWIKREGAESIAFEAGQHYERSSMDNHTAAILQTLAIKGCLAPNSLPSLKKHRNVLRESAEGTKSFYNVSYHYKIAPDESFKMNPGYISFQPVKEGEELAKNQDGPVYAPIDGAIFMPLYQMQGEDGFFIITPE